MWPTQLTPWGVAVLTDSPPHDGGRHTARRFIDTESARVPPPADAMGTFVVANEHGLHTRPAARLVSVVRGLDAVAYLRNATTGSGWALAESLSQIAALGALHGHRVEMSASGPQALRAVDAVLKLAPVGFGEAEIASLHPPAVAGIAGIGIGPSWRYTTSLNPFDDGASQGPSIEHERFIRACALARSEIGHARSQVGGESAAIFDVHLQLLDDPGIVAVTEDGIASGRTAEQAWSAAITAAAAALEALPDPYLRNRAADIRAAGHAVLRALSGASTPAEGPDGGVLIASEIAPADVAKLDPARTPAVALARSAATDHAVILLRARGIPVVPAAGEWILGIPSGTIVIVDSGAGTVIADPSADVLAKYRRNAENLAAQRAQALTSAGEPARTRDGVTVTVGATISSISEAVEANHSGADLAGLIRTEFLFLDRTTPPDAEEQYLTYRDIANALDGKRITIRTLDVGGDKNLPYLPGVLERNPMLGLRGIRYSLSHRLLFQQQLVAVARLAHETPVSVLFPMVSNLNEFMTARTMLEEAVVRTADRPPVGLEVGMMVEVPAAALNIGQFTHAVDFLSIGTNDLTQYLFAAERGNPQVAALADITDPAIFGLIQAICSQHPKVSICGELAANADALPRLISKGVRGLTVRPNLIPATKTAVRGCAVAEPSRHRDWSPSLP